MKTNLKIACIFLLILTSWNITAQIQDINLTNQWLPGPTFAVALAADNIAIHGNGGLLEIVDITDPGNAMSNAPEGTIIYCTDNDKLYVMKNNAWTFEMKAIIKNVQKN